jgi:hypothetical protein
MLRHRCLRRASAVSRAFSFSSGRAPAATTTALLERTRGRIFLDGAYRATARTLPVVAPRDGSEFSALAHASEVRVVIIRVLYALLYTPSSFLLLLLLLLL